jgi:hypothetical protein
MNTDYLFEILESRKKYVSEFYKSPDKNIALREIGVLERIVHKAGDTQEWQEMIGKTERKRVRTKPATKRMRRKPSSAKGLFEF